MDECNHSPNDGPVCLTCLDVLEAENDQLAQSLNVLMGVKNSVVDQRDRWKTIAKVYKTALEEIRQLVHPKGDEPRLEGCAGCKAEAALGSKEVASSRDKGQDE